MEEKRSVRAVAVLPYLFNLLCLGLTIFYCVWFITSGKFPEYPRLYNHYSDLAMAFLKGQVSLLKEPDPRLAELTDTHQAPKSGIPFIWDATYYHGKYYVYWGAAPSIFYMAWSAVSKAPAPAQVGVMFSYMGIACVYMIFLYSLRRHYYPRAPAFTIGLFTLAATINPPYALLLARPLTYETAILGGQFFLLVGFLFWFLFIIHRRGWMLVLCGLFMALSVLSRYDRLISVLVYTSFALLHFWFSRPPEARPFWRYRPAWIRSILLLAPLAVGAFAAMGYNAIRFGSPLETGLVYQLTDPVPGGRYYSPDFIRANLYVYLLVKNPLVPYFPFVSIDRFSPKDLPGWAPLEMGKQFDFGFYGLLQSTPLFWFVGLVMIALAVMVIRNRRAGRSTIPIDRTGPARMMAMLLLASLLQLAFLLFYYYSAVRFLSDFYLPLFTAGVLVMWEMDRMLVRKARLRGAYWATVTVLAAQTVLTGFFIGFNIFPYYFSQHNPPLYQAVEHFGTQYKDAIFTFLDPGSKLIGLFRR